MPSSPSSSSPPPPDREPTLLEEMVEALALSMLIFLYADVRMMSQTGRISLPFEWIAVDSDYRPRYTAAQLAGLQHTNGGDGSSTKSRSSSMTPPECKNEGLSTSQIMACLLLELQKHVEANRKAEEEQARASGSSTQELEHDKFTKFDSDPGGRKRKHTPTDEMSSLLKAYAEMIGSDLNAVVPHIQARRSVLNLTEPVPTMRDYSKLSSIAEEDEIDLAESKEEEKGEEEADFKAQASGLSSGLSSENSEVMSGTEHSENFFGKIQFGERAARRIRSQIQADVHNPITQSRMQKINERVNELAMNEEEIANKHYAEVTDALFHMGQSQQQLCQSVRKCNDLDDRVSISNDQMVKIMERAVESRVYGKLDFMADFFREGTVSQLMAKNQVKIVWINDWYPVKDLTYAIAVDPSRKRVIVVFRGAITRQDWAKAFDFKMIKVKNPIKEGPKTIGIYSGFYQYLFRARKDTGTTKYNEIVTMANKYGMEKIGEDYSLVVCGHSLGAALSTVFSFHASTEERFTNNGPIKVFTFGSPYVGGHDFADCWRHQEETRKLQYARFYNHNDLFAHIPDNFRPTKRGSKFRHVGIGIRIKAVPRWFQSCRSWKPSVYYVGNEGCCASYLRGMGRNFLLNTTWPWRMQRMHTLAELQHRIMEGSMLIEEDDKEGILQYLNKPINELYELLAGVGYKTSYA